MSVTTLDATEARSRLHKLIDETARMHRPIMITGDHGNALLLSEEDWNAINKMTGSTTEQWHESE